MRNVVNRRVARLALAAALAVLFVPLGGSAAQHYTSRTTPLFAALAGAPIGSLAPGTAVAVVGGSGDGAYVMIHGWSRHGADGTVYSDTAKQIVAVNEFTGPTTRGATRSQGDETYDAVTVAGWIASSALVDNVQDVWNAAGALYAQRCGTCHALKPPGAYPAARWPRIMPEQARNAGLDDAQRALITAYLQAQSAR